MPLAVGIEKKKIDLNRIKKVIQISGLDIFVSKLENNLDTFIGENGVKLSGGQRQRLSIARALYKDPQILIFDEATSALDVNTEKSVMDSISKISREITLIMVTHRLSSLSNCDRVIKLKNGRVEKIGSPKELLND